MKLDIVYDEQGIILSLIEGQYTTFPLNQSQTTQQLEEDWLR